MRIDEQGDKIACSKCRDGHRTSTCIDAPGHQDDVQVIRRAGRPEGSKNDPARAAERREKKRKRQVEKELEEEAAAFRREAHAFCLQRAASDPVQGNFAAGYPQLPVPGYQNLGSLANPHAPAPSFPRRSSFPPDPLPPGIPEPIRRLLEQPYYPGVGYAPASPTPAVPLPVSAPSVPDFPLTAPGHAASFDTMARNSLVNNSITGFPQVGMMTQADQVDNMMIQTTPEDLMEAGDTVLPVPSASFPALFPHNEDTWGMISWEGFMPG
ncbi:hypothetical protein FOC4_g10003250 [Fusarium odoratissimum]|uniref:Copper-fist domain-containing protein n=1 Tax=Fusarium oxysporum f. sp. cubense (strain race 4) TaxID=2502994 RepID=N1S4M7_FUSC4|nr:hypothetical protein FOC4_g10003250 [Fusarium odoratissimum]